MKSEAQNSVKTVFLCIAGGIVIGLVLKFFVFDILHVQGKSMEPTLHDGRSVFVNKLAYGLVKPFSDNLLTEWAQPQSNDVVIYLYNNKIVVKRCVAIGGMPLEYSTDSGYTLLVGEKQIPLTDLQYHRMKGSTVVPEHMILAVGDNYTQSIDSRTYGFISVDNVIGKVLCR